jgi:SAM-dependent methyltransferase
MTAGRAPGAVPADRSAEADRLVEIDLATVEKLPVLAALLAGSEGPALDLGSGLGYYARRLFAGHRPVVVADLDLSALAFAGRQVHPCRSDALRLPFRDATFGAVLLADVLEHCPEDAPVLAEIARVLRPGGRLVLSVPSLEWGFADFLPFLGVASVHDQEGPERHYTEGYTRAGLAAKLQGAGLEVIELREILRLGPKLLLDGLALVHLLVERLGPAKRTQWTWGSLVASPPPGLRLYRRLFPVVRGVRRGLELMSPRKGFELAAAARKVS